MFPICSPQGWGLQPRGIVPICLLRHKSFGVANLWVWLTKVLGCLSIPVHLLGKLERYHQMWVRAQKLLFLCQRRVRKGSWCRHLTLASQLGAQLMAAGHSALGNAFCPCALGAYLLACLEIRDLHISRSKEMKYIGKNKPNQHTPHTHPSKCILCCTIHWCPWERKLVRSITISAGRSLESFFCIYTELCPPELLSPTKGLQGISMAAGLTFMARSLPLSFCVRLPSHT